MPHVKVIKILLVAEHSVMKIVGVCLDGSLNVLITANTTP